LPLRAESACPSEGIVQFGKKDGYFLIKIIHLCRKDSGFLEDGSSQNSLFARFAANPGIIWIIY